jgi:hypothetical protein
MARKPKRKPAKPAPRTKPTARPSVPAAAPPPAPVMMTSAIPATPPAPVVKPRPSARYRRSSLTPAARRGADLVRFLRIHSKRPFARRGEEAIQRLAVEVGHLANAELGAVGGAAPPDAQRSPSEGANEQ